jgi:hypothetical protein
LLLNTATTPTCAAADFTLRSFHPVQTGIASSAGASKPLTAVPGAFLTGVGTVYWISFPYPSQINLNILNSSGLLPDNNLNGSLVNYI